MTAQQPAPNSASADSAASWSLAHLSDLHLTDPQPAPDARLSGKQRMGLASWRQTRRHVLSPNVLRALAADLLAHAPDRIAISGDLVQIGQRHEFDQAARWLADFAPPSRALLVPGNHEAYSTGTWETGRAVWRPYLTGALDGEPWVVRHERLLLIGLSSAVTTFAGLATGRLGKNQLTALDAALAQGLREGLFRVVVLHHPPAGAVSWRKRLTDRRQFAAIIARHGAGVILHGHTHRAMLSTLPGPQGPVPVVGAPAASSLDPRPGRMAGWGLLRITPDNAGWRLCLGRRVFRPDTQDFGWQEHCHLPTGG